MEVVKTHPGGGAAAVEVAGTPGCAHSTIRCSSSAVRICTVTGTRVMAGCCGGGDGRAMVAANDGCSGGFFVIRDGGVGRDDPLPCRWRCRKCASIWSCADDQRTGILLKSISILRSKANHFFVNCRSSGLTYIASTFSAMRRIMMTKINSNALKAMTNSRID